MDRYKVGVWQINDEELAVANEIPLDANRVYFDNTTTLGQLIGGSNLQQSIENVFLASKSFSFPVHFTNGLNTSMSNGAIFRVWPSQEPSMSYSGYPAAKPLMVKCKAVLESISLAFRVAAFDFNAVAGPILFELEVRTHLFNGSEISQRVLVRFGNFSGNSTNTSNHKFDLFYNDQGEQGFEYIDDQTYDRNVYPADQIGYRFVKASTGVRRINSFTDIVMTCSYKAVV